MRGAEKLIRAVQARCVTMDKLQSILPHFHFLEAYPTKIEATHGETFDLRGERGETFSRFHWENGDVQFLESVNEDQAGPAHFLARFPLETRTWIGRMGSTGPIPTEESIPDDCLVGLIEVHFNIEYRVSAVPDTLDAEGVSAFARMNVPYHLWPFWREAIQSFAIRMRLPVPSLPHFKVPDQGKPASKESLGAE